MLCRDTTVEDSYFISDTLCLQEAAEQIKELFDAKYKLADHDEVIDRSTYLLSDQQDKLKMLLTNYEKLFDGGSLGQWVGEEYHIELKTNAKPYHVQAFPIPCIQK
jgi:hypothetical protein